MGGLAFNVIVWALFGWQIALVWFDGYILEYLLSMDNVFFFHVVFTAYATPPSQTYKGLFLGIVGAVVLRLLFYVVGAEFFRLAFVVQIFFGVVLVYSGYKTATTDEEDDDPRSNRCVIWLTYWLPLVDRYEDDGRLFTWDDAALSEAQEAEAVGDSAADGNSMSAPRAIRPRGTMLLLVSVVLQIVDVVFAVDSVTAKIAEYDNIFLNFSSSAFAMLCLRAMYFGIMEMVHYFRFLKYGVAVILVLIGLKLIVAHWFEVHFLYSLAMICGVFVLSLSLSALFPATDADEDDGAPACRQTSPVGQTVIGKLDGLAAEDGTETELRKLSTDIDDVETVDQNDRR